MMKKILFSLISFAAFLTKADGPFEGAIAGSGGNVSSNSIVTALGFVPTAQGGNATNAIGKTNGVGVGTTTVDLLVATNFVGNGTGISNLSVTAGPFVGSASGGKGTNTLFYSNNIISADISARILYDKDESPAIDYGNPGTAIAAADLEIGGNLRLSGYSILGDAASQHQWVTGPWHRQTNGAGGFGFGGDGSYSLINTNGNIFSTNANGVNRWIGYTNGSLGVSANITAGLTLSGSEVICNATFSSDLQSSFGQFVYSDGQGDFNVGKLTVGEADGNVSSPVNTDLNFEVAGKGAFSDTLFLTNGLVLATNSTILFRTNYVAANFTPVAGFAKITCSNGVLYKVTQLSTNLFTITP